MALKHIKEYYDKVFFSYKKALDLLDQINLKSQDRFITPEEVEENKQLIKPIEDNYNTISYFMYLLGKSVDDVKKYYSKLYRLNEETKQDYVEFEEYALSSGNVDSKTLLNRREYALSSQRNFEEISWLVYLLNLPNKKKKRKRYIQLNEKRVSQLALDTKYDYKLEEMNKYVEELKNKL